jgi:hypothetical protein
MEGLLEDSVSEAQVQTGPFSGLLGQAEQPVPGAWISVAVRALRSQLSSFKTDERATSSRIVPHPYSPPL